MPIATWDMRVYDLDGNEVNVLEEYHDPAWVIPLNGLDNLTCSLYLDDPAAADISMLDKVVKIWRTVDDDVYSKSYVPDPGTPDFAGVINSVRKAGDENLLTFTAFNPMWRLQSRFHIYPHYLVIDQDGQAYEGANEDNDTYDQSAAMWKLIDLVSGAFGVFSVTGIRKPTGSAPFWPKTVEIAPFRAPKGNNTWNEIFDDLLNRQFGADLTPEYIHSAGLSDLMYFKTAEYRGADKSATVALNYHTDPVLGVATSNCESFEEFAQAVPGEFANFVWAVGQGGVFQSVGEAIDDTGNPFSWDQVGNYMKRIDLEITDLVALQEIAEAELERSRTPSFTYSVTPSPTKPPYYQTDFVTGDLVELNADKGALQVDGVKQRIYQTTLKHSDNRVETAELLLAPNFFSKVPEV